MLAFRVENHTRASRRFDNSLMSKSQVVYSGACDLARKKHRVSQALHNVFTNCSVPDKNSGSNVRLFFGFLRKHWFLSHSLVQPVLVNNDNDDKRNLKAINFIEKFVRNVLFYVNLITSKSSRIKGKKNGE